MPAPWLDSANSRGQRSVDSARCVSITADRPRTRLVIACNSRRDESGKERGEPRPSSAAGRDGRDTGVLGGLG